jgi:hypothetical protein
MANVDREMRSIGPRIHLAIALLLISIAMLTIAHEAQGEDYTPSEPWTFRSEWGWYDGDRVTYYDLGRSSNSSSPAYRMVDGIGNPIEGQGLIFGELRPGVLVDAPFSPSYSDFHRIWDVQVPAGYVPDEIRSLSAIQAANLTMVERDLVLNSPMVPAGSTLIGTGSGSHPLLQGWWEDQTVHYFRFESSADTPGLFDPAMDLVRDSGALAVFDPPGQLEILDDYPGKATWSPLTRLYIFNPISTEYIADSVRTWDEAVGLGFAVFPEGNLYNRPIVGGRETVPRFEHGERQVFPLLEAWWSETSKVLYYDMGPLPDTSTAGFTPLYRFVTKEGAPIIHQHYIVDTVAPHVLVGSVDSVDYSPLWRFFDVVIEDEASFEPDTIKSMDDVRSLGFTIKETDEFLLAPMVARDHTFMPVPSNPPGDGLEQVWYEGMGLYIVLLGNTTLVHEGPGTSVWTIETTNLTYLLDPAKAVYPNQRPILHELPDDEGYSPLWEHVYMEGGDGFRPDRFRSVEQLLERGWTVDSTSGGILGGFVAGPINVPAWKPANFTFMVGPVMDEDGNRIRGAEVRVSRGVEVITGTTDKQGLVSFEVESAWNGKTVQTFISKEGYFTVNFPAEIVDYETFVPSGGYVPELASEEDGGGFDGGTALALGGVLVIVLVVFAMLMRGRRTEGPSITEEEADEIFSDEDSDEEDR